MIHKRVILLMAFIILAISPVCSAVELPVCSNRIINEVTKRVGCTIGDANCWLSKGGMCTDYILMRTGRSGTAFRLDKRVAPDAVRKGDVALFITRAHYAYVESVSKDRNGKPVAVTVSEYNYGTCWVDRSTMVTDHYKKVNKRIDMPLNQVDGGFLRP